MKSFLKARIMKLENQSKSGVVPAVIFGECGRAEGEVIAISSNGIKIERKPGELVEEMVMRAGPQLNQRIAFLAYSIGKCGDDCIFSPKVQFNY